MKLLIDSNFLCHQAKHSMGDLDFESQKTGIIFGFLRQLLKLSQLYPKSDFIFCWDSKTSLRKKIYPEYKANRKKEKSDEEKEADSIAYAQFELIKTYVLPEIGYRNIFEYEGFESDDIFARIIYTTSDDFVIVTSDEDIYQLLFDSVKIYNPGKKKEYTLWDFQNEYGISPEFWFDVKAIAGCVSDNVKGIAGVGAKTAIKYLTNQLDVLSTKFQAIESEEGQVLIKRNYRLVRLPYKSTPKSKFGKDGLSLDKFMTVCQRYGFYSILAPKELRKWEEHLRLE
jgi:DNA polymerase-1